MFWETPLYGAIFMAEESGTPSDIEELTFHWGGGGRQLLLGQHVTELYVVKYAVDR